VKERRSNTNKQAYKIGIMVFPRALLSAYGWLCVVALLSLSFSTMAAEAKTAILFGATGGVGNEVLRAILRNNSFFTKLIIVGRSFTPKVTDLLPESTSLRLPEVIKVQLADLGNIDQNEELLAMEAVDACFIATASGHPYLHDFGDWHFVEVDLVASITRLCEKLKVRSLTAFSAVDPLPAETPRHYTKEKLENGRDGTPMGWWQMLLEMTNIMKLKEVALTDNSRSIPFVRIHQPSNIITEKIRYGWLDWTLFKILPWIDPWIPTKYHSVNVTLLGMAMVQDAIRLLSGTTGSDNEDDHDGPRTYGDFLRIAGTDFAAWEEEQRILKEDKNKEL